MLFQTNVSCGLDVCATVAARLCNYKQEIAYGPELDHSGLQNTTFTVIRSDLYDKEKCTGNFIYIYKTFLFKSTINSGKVKSK